jgi:DNA-binding XRE family transcriptional regulator
VTSGVIPAKKSAARKKTPARKQGEEWRPLARLVGKNVRRRREALELSQRALARLCGMSQRHLSLIEIEGSNMTLATLVALAKHLHTAAASLLSSDNR